MVSRGFVQGLIFGLLLIAVLIDGVRLQRATKIMKGKEEKK